MLNNRISKFLGPGAAPAPSSAAADAFVAVPMLPGMTPANPLVAVTQAQIYQMARAAAEEAVRNAGIDPDWFSP